MRSIFGPLKLDANARGLELETSLDPRIDEVATKAAHQESECQLIGEGSGIVMGDEMRLRQVINNRASRPSLFPRSLLMIRVRQCAVMRASSVLQVARLPSRRPSSTLPNPIHRTPPTLPRTTAAPPPRTLRLVLTLLDSRRVDCRNTKQRR